MEVDLKKLLPSLELRQFERRPSCPKCGIAEGEYVNLQGGYSREMYSVSIGYCKGNQQPIVTHEVENFITGKKSEHSHEMPCAGVIEEHLHCTCDNCRYSWLMKVKP